MLISKRYSLALVLLLAFSIIEAQKNKETKGFIITLQNDTIPCIFKQKNWKKQPTQITVNYKNRDTSFSPQTINGFVVINTQLEFVSRTVRLTNYIDKIQDATTYKVPELAPEQKMFFKILYKGRFNLLLGMDNLNRKHFFIEGPGNLVELYSHYYIQLPPATRPYDVPITVLDKSYEFVLKTLMTPCRSLFGIIENIGPDEEQLKQVCKLYDMCIDSKKED